MLRLLSLLLLPMAGPSPTPGSFVEWMEPPARPRGSGQALVLLGPDWTPPGRAGDRLVVAPLQGQALVAALGLALSRPGVSGLLAPDLQWRFRRRMPARLLTRELPMDTWFLALLEDPAGRMKKAWLLLRPSLHILAQVHGHRALLLVSRRGRPVPGARLRLLDRLGPSGQTRTDRSGAAVVELRAPRMLALAEDRGKIGAILLARLPRARPCRLTALATSPARPRPGGRLSFLGHLRGPKPERAEVLLGGPGRKTMHLGEVWPSRTGLVAGRVTLPRLAAAGPAWLVLRAKGCTSARVPMTLQPGRGDPEHLALSLEPGFFQVRIRAFIERPWAGPPAGLPVRISWGWRSRRGLPLDLAGGEARVETDARGRASLTLDWPALSVDNLWVRAETTHLGRPLATVAWMPPAGLGLSPAGPGLWLPAGHHPEHLLDPKGRHWPCWTWPVALCEGPRQGPVASVQAGRLRVVERKSTRRTRALRLSLQGSEFVVRASRPGLVLATALCEDRWIWRVSTTGALRLSIPRSCIPEGLVSLVTPSGESQTVRLPAPRKRPPRPGKFERRRDADCVRLEGAPEWGLLFGAERLCHGATWGPWASADGILPARQHWSCHSVQATSRSVLLAALGPKSRVCGPPGPVAVASAEGVSLLQDEPGSEPLRGPERVRLADRLCLPRGRTAGEELRVRDLAFEGSTPSGSICVRVTGPHPRMASLSSFWEPHLLPDRPPLAWRASRRPLPASTRLVVASGLRPWALTWALRIARQPVTDLEMATARLFVRLAWPLGNEKLLPSAVSLVEHLAKQVSRLRGTCDEAWIWRAALALLALRESNLGAAFGPASFLEGLIEGCPPSDPDTGAALAWSAALVLGRAAVRKGRTALPQTASGLAAAIWAGLETDISLSRFRRLARALDRNVTSLLAGPRPRLQDASLALLVARRFLPTAPWRRKLAQRLAGYLRNLRSASPLAVGLALYALADRHPGRLQVRCAGTLCQELSCRGEMALWPAPSSSAGPRPSFQGPCPGAALWLTRRCESTGLQVRVRWRGTAARLHLVASHALDRPCLLLSTPGGIVPDLLPPHRGTPFPVDWAASRPWGAVACHNARLPAGRYGLRLSLPRPAPGRKPATSCVVAWPSECVCDGESRREMK